jgi:hypothetical protein
VRLKANSVSPLNPPGILPQLSDRTKEGARAEVIDEDSRRKRKELGTREEALNMSFHR